MGGGSGNDALQRGQERKSIGGHAVGRTVGIGVVKWPSAGPGDGVGDRLGRVTQAPV